MAIISPTSITQEAILADIERWLAAQPGGSGWGTAFAGENGRIALELLAGVAVLLSMQSRAARRESNALTARLRSSVLALAYTLGYPVNRRRAARLSVTLTNSNSPGGASITLGRRPALGLSGSPLRPVSILQSGESTLAPGQTAKVLCAVGEWHRQSGLAARVGSFSELDIPLPSGREVVDVDNDAVELAVANGGASVPLGRYLELINDDPANPQAWIKTHVNSLVVLFGASRAGARVFGYSVQGGASSFDADYLLLPTQLGGDLDSFGTFAPNAADWPGLRVDAVQLAERELPADDTSKIARVLPGYFAAKRRMVTADDHRAIVLSYPGMLDAALESGTCASPDGDPLAEESIHSEAQCTAQGGTWRTRSMDAGCVSVVSYLRASTANPALPDRYAAGDTIPAGSLAGDPRPFTDPQETAIEGYLRDFQTLGSELVFRPGIPVRVVVHMAYRPTGDRNLSPDQLTALENHVHASVRSQCFKMGGTFDISKLHADILAHGSVAAVILQTPRNNRTLSWLGYFDYRDDAVIAAYTESQLTVQGIDRVTAAGYVVRTRAARARLAMDVKPKADTARLLLGIEPNNLAPRMASEIASGG